MLQQKDAVGFLADVTVVTTNETVIVTGNAVTLPFSTAKAVIKAFVNFNPGTGTTGVTWRIRRGTQVTDPLVGELSSEVAGVTPGSARGFFLALFEFLTLPANVQYCLTVQQAAATGNGTATQGLIETELLSG